nr:hypothetical protein [Tanacetum cinerariifolium]
VVDGGVVGGGDDSWGDGGVRWWSGDGGTVRQRVGASDMVDRIDRKVMILFGFAGKSPPEKFSGGGGVVAGWPAAGVGGISDDESFSDEDISKKIYSNPLFDAEIISMKIDLHYSNAESDLIESLLNHDSSIISSSSKIDSLLVEFAGELILLKTISPGIDETDCDPEEEIRLIEKLLYDNSSPRPSKEFISENSNAEIESFSPFPIPVEESDSLLEEIDLSFTPDDPMPPGIEEDEYDSERDILILEELLSNDSFSLPKNESFHFDIPSFPRPPAKPPDDDSGILTVKVVGDISEHDVPMLKLLPTQPTLVSNQEKSPHLLSHQSFKASQLHSESQVMIYGGNTPIMDVLFLHFYPLDQLKYGGIGSS